MIGFDIKNIIKKILLIVVLFVFGFYAFFAFKGETSSLVITKTSKMPHEEYISVIINGEVNNPGTYIVLKGQTLYDAIYKASGVTPYADLKSINLDMPLFCDSEITLGSLYNEKLNIKKVNLNTSSLDELESIDGIGEKLAERILNYRHTQSKFKTIEEIKNVKGIGDKLFDKIKDHICV